MRIYWYWPFAREEDFSISTWTLRADNDRLMCHTIDRSGVPASDDRRIEVRADLADVTPQQSGSLRWAFARASTYEQRRRTRRRAVADGGYDVAHIWFQNYFTDAVDLPRLADHSGALVCNVHDVRPHLPRLPPWILDRVLGRLYRAGDALIVHHEDLRRDLLDFGVDPNRIVVIPHQVPAFRDAGVPRPAPSTPQVLFFGTMRPNKGVKVLLEALDLMETVNDVGFHFAGRGDPGIEALVERAAADRPNVTAEIGWISSRRKHELYDDASVVVLPYTSFASQSGVLHDAYGHHLPVVVTDVGALGSTVREDGTGWVADPGDAEALAACLDRAVTDEGAWHRASGAAAAVAADRSPEQTGRRLRRLYDDLLSS